LFNVAVACLVLTALLAYVNKRFIGLPTTIGVMAIALLLSVALLGLDAAGFTGLHEAEAALLAQIDFSGVLMQGMLSILLFAGALHIDLHELRRFRWQIGVLALGGTALSTVIIGWTLFQVAPWVGIALPLSYCLVFGALISPTDPIAVISIVKSAGAPKSLEVVIAGESLFNDGVGVVLFTLLFGTLAFQEQPTWSHAAVLLAREAGGGIAFGLLLGYVAYLLLKSIDSYQEEVLITLAAVLGGYWLAAWLHVSGPLAMVAAGLVVGGRGRAVAMSDTTREHVDMFWDLLDAILNSVLFVLLGLEATLMTHLPHYAAGAVAAILITLCARLISVALPAVAFRRSFALPRGALQILTWGGLRGGISVALVLSLPALPDRDILLALTYAVVVFSILVQGMSIGAVTRCATRDRAGTDPKSG
jgi:CPA1 family monovalent cation:H+ antiporter